ncbi:hypothetical protein HYU13_02275 [Candidatus Woesearchaeota archaeon]|nr:hypothetical protein [Candidatus Woesearchaeota archaeon]
MATILFAVAGEGYGHAVRAKEVLNFLSKKHSLIIVGGGKAYQYLKSVYPIRDIGYLSLIFGNGRLSALKTFAWNLLRFPYLLAKSAKLIWLISSRKPDILLSDFEPFSRYAALLFRLPCLNIAFPFLDPGVLRQMTAKGSLQKRIEFFLARAVVTLFSPVPQKTILPCFFPLPKASANTKVIPSIIREDILQKKPAKGNYFLVYATKAANPSLFDALQRLPYPCKVYGSKKDAEVGNICYRKFDDVAYTEDLAGCMAFISTGSYNTLAEAIALRKPILAIPSKGYFERKMNSSMVEKLGYGKVEKALTIASIERFIGALPVYEQNLRRRKKEDYRAYRREIEDTIRELMGYG